MHMVSPVPLHSGKDCLQPCARQHSWADSPNGIHITKSSADDMDVTRNDVQVLDAVMRFSDRTAGEESEHVGQQLEVLSWAAAIDDTGHPPPPSPPSPLLSKQGLTCLLVEFSSACLIYTKSCNHLHAL